MTGDPTVEGSVPPARDVAAGERGFLDYLEVLRSRWHLVVIGSLACGLAALIVSLRVPELYEATVSVRVAGPAMVDGRVTDAIAASSRALIRSRTVAAQLIAEFQLDRQPHGFAAQSFAERALSIDRVADTPIFDVTVRLGGSELSTQVANRLGEIVASESRKKAEAEARLRHDLLKAEVEQARARMETSRAEITEYRSEVQIEDLQKRVDWLVTERANYRNLLLDLESERSRLAQLKEEISRQERLLTEKSLVDASEFMLKTPTESKELPLDLQTQGGFINPVYQILELRIAESRSRVAALEARRRELDEKYGLNRSRLEALDQLYKDSVVLNDLGSQFELAKDIYQGHARRFEEARIQAAGQGVWLEIADRAYPASRPLPRNTPLNVMAALLAGLVLSVLVVFFVDFLHTPRGWNRPQPTGSQQMGS